MAAAKTWITETGFWWGAGSLAPRRIARALSTVRVYGTFSKACLVRRGRVQVNAAVSRRRPRHAEVPPSGRRLDDDPDRCRNGFQEGGLFPHDRRERDGGARAGAGSETRSNPRGHRHAGAQRLRALREGPRRRDAQADAGASPRRG